MDFNIIFDAFIFLSGLYLGYSGFEMKRSGKIQRSLVSQNIDLKKAKDADGFVGYMSVKTMAVGGIAAVCGLFSIYNDYCGKGYDMAQFIALGVYFFALVAYGVLLVKAQKRFLQS